MSGLILQAPMAGSAVRVFISPPPLAGALTWRVLRRTADAFTGPDDAGAYLVHDGSDHVVLDISGLVNGVAYFYRLYTWNGAAWTDQGVASVTPAATYADEGVDVQDLVRDRLIAGLAVEVAAGRLAHPAGVIPVRTGMPQQKDGALPIVTALLNTDAPNQRGIGEDMGGHDEFDEYEGWLSSVRVGVAGWSFNPDERIALRKALKRIVLANLAVFDAAGLVQIDFQQQDEEGINPLISETAPVYVTMGTFACLAPSQVVGGSAGSIADLTVTAL